MVGATAERAALDRIADRLGSLDADAKAQREIDRAALQVLRELLATNAAQSEMLSDILAAATDDPGPSPVGEALVDMAVVLRRLVELVEGLPAAVASAVASEIHKAA